MAVIRYYYLYEDEVRRRSLISSAAILTTSVFFAIAVLSVPIATPAAALLFGTAGLEHLVPLAAINLAIGASLEVPMVVFRARQSSFSAVTAGLARLVIGLALNILFVVVLRFGVVGVLLSSILASSVVGGYLLWQLLREVGFRFDTKIARSLIVFGAPLVIWEISSFVLHFSDRYFLRASASLADVGVYSLAYKFAMLVAMFVSGPFGNIWFPKAFELERIGHASASKALWDIARMYNLVLVSVAVAIALVARDTIRLVTGPEFHAASDSVPLLALGMVFFGYRPLAQYGALVRERSDLVAKASAVAAVAVLLLNAFLIPRWGVNGAAAATATAFAVEFFVMRRLSERVHEFRLSAGGLLRPLWCGVVVVALTAMLIPPSLQPIPSFLAHGASLVGYLLLLLLSRSVERAELLLIYRLLKKPRALLAALRSA
jgi:O-antigen/teichoic acid export membrane protein